jgi:NDP-sugar pyrophosphorylase family protein
LKALILAAGLGTRLYPITANIPKALVRINGISLLELAIRKVSAEGFRDIIVNIHHHAGQVREFLKEHNFPDVSVSVSDESGQLLGTGGAIMKARWFLDGSQPFLVHNVDVISNVSLQSILHDHSVKKGLATLSVSERVSSRYFLFDDQMKLIGWTDTSSGEKRFAGYHSGNTTPLAFSGIHIISPEIFNLFKTTGSFSIIDTYLDLAAESNIFGHPQPGIAWFDLGKPEQLEVVSKYLRDHPGSCSSL